MELLITKILDYIDNNYHQKNIEKELKKINLKIVIDVGAHKGEFLNSILRLNKKIKIFSFEPQKKIFFYLRSKFKKKKNVFTFNNAMSDKSGTKLLKINIKSSTSTFSDYNQDSYWKKFKDLVLTGFNSSSILGTEKVKVSTLDKFCNKKKLHKIDLLKIDTEGHELDVLKGAEKILKNKVQYILIEFHFSRIYKKYNKDKIEKILKKNNFYLLKKFKFPFLTFEDRLYKKLV
jgi:FkbM family methyltransferase